MSPADKEDMLELLREVVQGTKVEAADDYGRPCQVVDYEILVANIDQAIAEARSARRDIP